MADPDALATEPAPAVPAAPEASRRVRALVRPGDDELARILDIRVTELIAYQNEDYARTTPSLSSRCAPGPVTARSPGRSRTTSTNSWPTRTNNSFQNDRRVCWP
ncbi:hypothetical protein ACFWQL_40220 [Amycolatopsis thermoflava]|uniref:hypothetical protein n=1 Tax=Amycolatopsis thermoflava TaxID=84480 RepID=UPI00366427C9